MFEFARNTLLAALAAVAIGSTDAEAVTFTFDSNGGNGIAVSNGPVGGTSFGLTLISNNDDQDGIFTTATAVADAAYTVTGSWLFASFDIDGSSLDPFGYFIDNIFVQLSTDDLPFPAIHTGTFSFVVAAGQSFGFYTVATDGTLGASTSFVTGSLTPTPIPLPAGGLLLIAALGGLAALRRRTTV